ncbi:MAG: hypothetical protein GY854_31950 [Deltaproteobacteria bacterium]|nr:hypothetical protein [Deltaproteobacteria bacterium]
MPRSTRTRAVLAWLFRHAHLVFPLAAAVLTLMSTHILLGPVINRSGDNCHHLMSEFAVLHSIAAGDNPFGPVSIDFGQPVLRFYQCLFYLVNVTGHLISGIDLVTVHNFTIITSFALSPFAYLFFLRKLGINRFAAAIGSFVTMISIASFGNSIEAYHCTGIVTQSLGGFFFPLFMGCFIGMLRGENRASTTALLFALAFLSHAIMAVFAATAGALYFLVTNTNLKSIKKLAAFCLIGATLVSFWTFPFIEHTLEQRPVPDAIIRGPARAFWFNSVTKEELTVVAASGRLLDDPAVLHKDQKNSYDKLMDKISIMGTKKTRLPVVTFLTALGALFALFGLGRTSRRFLLAGFAFALMLFAGPDDFRWLVKVPFMKQIQPFRCTYLVEFFAFGLVAVGFETVLKKVWVCLSRMKRVVGYVLFGLWLVVIGASITWCGNEILALGKTHLTIRNQTRIDAAVDAASSLENLGYPYRVKAAFQSAKVYQDWLVKYGFQTFGTHWVAVGPSAGFHLAWALGSPVANGDLYAMTGIRYISGDSKGTKSFLAAKDNAGDPYFELLPNGPDRRRKSNKWHYLLDTGRDHFLRPVVGQPLPVVCNDAQWIWLAKSWTERFGRNTPNPHRPLPMRVTAGQLDSSGLLERAQSLLYLDHTVLPSDREAVASFAAVSGNVISTIPISGLETSTLDNKKSLWTELSRAINKPSKKKTHEREERDEIFETADLRRLDTKTRTLQSFSFDVSLLEPIVAVLPMTAVPGWNAMLDGKPLELFPTGPNMLGVSLPKGAHRVVFYWKMPARHVSTLVASLIALVIVLVSWVPLPGRRQRR